MPSTWQRDVQVNAAPLRAREAKAKYSWVLILVIIAGVGGILSATSGCVPSSHWHWYFNRNIE